MRSQLLLVPAALIASAPALAADGYYFITPTQVRAQLFPGLKLTPRDMFLTEAQRNQLKKVANTVVWSNSIKAWQASNGGWLFLDQVAGREDMITYAVALNPDGTLRAIEILQCVPRYDQVRNPAWLAQFIGRRHGNAPTETEVISGTTLSAIHITDGVRRVLATYALFYAAPSS